MGTVLSRGGFAIGEHERSTISYQAKVSSKGMASIKDMIQQTLSLTFVITALGNLQTYRVAFCNYLCNCLSRICTLELSFQRLVFSNSRGLQEKT